jgi:hypothetical protein
VLVRLLVKVGGRAGVRAPVRHLGRKGALSGVALAPLSVFVILLIEQRAAWACRFDYSLAPLAAMALLLQVFGP